MEKRWTESLLNPQFLLTHVRNPRRPVIHRRRQAQAPSLCPGESSAKNQKSRCPRMNDCYDAAIEEAKELVAVEKMKLCYKLKEDEWWVSIYVDIRDRIDVKQFIWNRELENLEPFLVPKEDSEEQAGLRTQQSRAGKHMRSRDASSAHSAVGNGWDTPEAPPTHLFQRILTHFTHRIIEGAQRCFNSGPETATSLQQLLHTACLWTAFRHRERVVEPSPVEASPR